MECPYCHKDMEFGYIEGGSMEMNWKSQKTSVFRSANAENNPGAVMLAPFSAASYFNKNRVKAWLCRDCGKIIIDCENASED